MQDIRSVDSVQRGPVDRDKVAAFRTRIATGAYRIDPRAIARAMIAFDLQTASG
ncbi:flagellar biosynthesis anti-sigma factor FlgM [Sphingomonas sp. MMS24-J13]|uniref:flagellar biosynthesis anti-sigma factor FlgM n=1 Tax=Sphingomonas sp. MMS24-J13 TaxID=3238686 RepID=UPI00384B1910